jgi:hypothetical protein
MGGLGRQHLDELGGRIRLVHDGESGRHQISGAERPGRIERGADGSHPLAIDQITPRQNPDDPARGVANRRRADVARDQRARRIGERRGRRQREHVAGHDVADRGHGGTSQHFDLSR